MKAYFDRADNNCNEMQTEAGKLEFAMSAKRNPLNNNKATRAFKQSQINLATVVQSNQQMHIQLQ